MIRTTHPTILTPETIEFLWQSNLIEDEPSAEALAGALRAWDWINQNTTEEHFYIGDIMVIHRFLMENLNSRIAGRIRKVNVTVGNKTCPNPGSLGRLLALWFDTYRGADTEELIKEAHIKFEGIHPFEDGNGRIGRIIMNWQHIKTGLPILIIKEREKEEYYKWFDT